jgi:hypothetical protein
MDLELDLVVADRQGTDCAGDASSGPTPRPVGSAARQDASLQQGADRRLAYEDTRNVVAMSCSELSVPAAISCASWFKPSRRRRAR